MLKSAFCDCFATSGLGFCLGRQTRLTAGFARTDAGTTRSATDYCLPTSRTHEADSNAFSCLSPSQLMLVLWKRTKKCRIDFF